MAFTLGVGAGTSGSGTSLTVAPGSVTAHSLLIVGVLCHGTPTVTSDSVNTVGNWHALTDYSNIPGSSKHMRLFYYLDAVAGSPSIVFGTSASGNFWAWCQEFKTGGVGATYDSGVSSEVPLTGVTSAIVAAANAPAASGELIVYLAGANNDSTHAFTVGSNLDAITAQEAASPSATFVMAHKLSSGNTLVSYNTTTSSDNFGVLVEGFALASASTSETSAMARTRSMAATPTVFVPVTGHLARTHGGLGTETTMIPMTAVMSRAHGGVGNETIIIPMTAIMGRTHGGVGTQTIVTSLTSPMQRQTKMTAATPFVFVPVQDFGYDFNTTFGWDLYQRLAPGWRNHDVAAWCDTIGSMAEPVYTLVYDSGPDDGSPNFVPGYGRLFDPDDPACDLSFLGQFVGVEIPTGSTRDTAESLVLAEAGQNRGTLAAITSAALRFLIGTKSLQVLERTGIGGSNDAYQFTIIVRPEEVTSVQGLIDAVNAVKPAGLYWTLVQTDNYIWSSATGTWATDTMTWVQAASIHP